MSIHTEFKNLHQKGNPFVLVNVWDQGSAKLAQDCGAQALGTTSAGYALTLGRSDGGNISRDEALGHAQDIVSCSQIPVSADLENGFGHSPEDVVETIKQAHEVGLSGCTIEDAALPDDYSYDFELAVERMRAGLDAVRQLPDDFILTMRADGVLNGHYDFEEALKRAKAYDALGADCIYVPSPPNFDDLKRLCQSTNAHINALVSGQYMNMHRSQFADIGVSRISLGSVLARSVAGFAQAQIQGIMQNGDFSHLSGGISFDSLDKIFAK